MRALMFLKISLAAFAVHASAVSALAQDAKVLEPRVSKLESEMRAVQRKVFPGGSPKYFEPEYPQNQSGAPDAPTTTADQRGLADVQARLLELEKQLRELTGRVEQNENQTRMLEEQFKLFKADVEARFGKIETAGASAAVIAPTPIPAGSAATPSTVTPTPKPSSAAPVSAPNSPETAYKSAYALFEAKNYDRAEIAFKGFLDKYGYKSDKERGHALAANAQYWLGRSHVNKKAYAQAARAFLEGYQHYPKSDKAPDSLLGLGESLIALNKPQEACSAFNELQAVYPNASADIKAKLKTGRTKAGCK